MDDLTGWLEQLTGGDDEKAEAAARRLPDFGLPALEALTRLARDPQADVRWWALRALVEFSATESKDLLRTALEDQEPAVRQCAALGLRKQPDPEAVPALIAGLQDPDRLFAALAADALVAIGEPSVPALLEVMENGPQAARLEAVRALAEIGDQRAIPVLFNALDEDSALIEHWASEGLERMGVGMTFFKPG